MVLLQKRTTGARPPLFGLCTFNSIIGDLCVLFGPYSQWELNCLIDAAVLPAFLPNLTLQFGLLELLAHFFKADIKKCLRIRLLHLLHLNQGL